MHSAFVGYQAVGTLGRSLIEGATDVKLFGEEIHVNADIVRLAGISGHADNQGLMKWAAAFSEKPQKVFVTHGDDQVCELLPKDWKKSWGTLRSPPTAERSWICFPAR